MKTHIFNAHKIGGQKCHYCEKNFAVGELESHISAMHICNVCKKHFKENKDLKKHISNCHKEVKTVHDGRKDFKCYECGKTFTQPIGLSRHIKLIHEGQKVYVCHLCSKFFTRASSLKSHIKAIHERRKDYFQYF